MRYLKAQYFVFSGIILLAIFSACKREDVRPYAATEVFPEDVILQTIENKRAMIVIAHDDDMCVMSGTISALNQNGWEIRVVSISMGENRNSVHRNACKNLLDSVMFYDFSESEFRIDTASIKYAAVPKNKFNEMYNRPLVVQEMVEIMSLFAGIF